MTLPHFHSFKPAGVYPKNRAFELILEKDTIAHMISLRMKTQERFVLVDSKACADTFELLAPPARDCEYVSVRYCGRSQYFRRANVVLVQGISKGDRMDQTIRQATELGVARIIPLESARSTVRLTSEARLVKQKRWQALANAAADQAACAFAPEIVTPCKLSDILAIISQNDVVLVAWEEYKGQGIREALAKAMDREYDARWGNGQTNGHSDGQTNAHGSAQTNGHSDTMQGNRHVYVFIGSEGGFEEDEVKALCSIGAQPVSLGRTILRTETAAIVACALVLHELGELGNQSRSDNCSQTSSQLEPDNRPESTNHFKSDSWSDT